LDGASLLRSDQQAKVQRAAGLLDHALLQPLVDWFSQVHLYMWVDWAKPLVDRMLIWLSHNTVFEKSNLSVIAIKTEASPSFQ
jgi:hypothetical protein